MKKYAFQKCEYEASLNVEISNKNLVEISTNDRAETRTLSFHLNDKEVDCLIQVLQDWKNQNKVRGHISKNEKFSWFSSRSED